MNVTRKWSRSNFSNFDRAASREMISKINPETLKYCVGVQWGQSYLMGRRCPFVSHPFSGVVS